MMESKTWKLQKLIKINLLLKDLKATLVEGFNESMLFSELSLIGL